MTLERDHTIVPAHDKEASARFFARIFGLSRSDQPREPQGRSSFVVVTRIGRGS